jgi:E3 ubiquitin-protein ligase UBR4
MEIAHSLLPSVFVLIEAYTVFLRSSLLAQLINPEDKDAASGVQLCSAILSISSAKVSKSGIHRPTVIHHLPCGNVIEKWTNNTAHEFPTVGSWRNAFANDILPGESYMDAILMTHLGAFSSLCNWFSIALNFVFFSHLQIAVNFVPPLL